MIRHASLALLIAALVWTAPAAQTPSTPTYTVTDWGRWAALTGPGSAINAAGQVAGMAKTSGDSAYHAFRSDGTSMTDLGSLGGTQSWGTAINTAGQVIWWDYRSGHYHAFRFEGTTSTDLGTLGGTESVANAINTAGQVTGSSQVSGDAARHAFLFGTTMSDLGTLGGTESVGYAINTAGQVTGSSQVSGDAARHAFLFGTTMSDLGTLGGTESVGYAINTAGQVTGWASLSCNTLFCAQPRHAFRSDGTSMTNLGSLGGTESYGVAINTAGQVTGWATMPSSTARHAFRWDGTMMIDLGTLDGRESFANAINTAGQVTGFSTFTTPSGGSLRHAFLSIPGAAMLDLNDLIPSGSGWVLSNGSAINDRGQITGDGEIDGQTHAFLLTPVTTTFSFTGFYPPVDNAPVVNAVKAGAAVPVKFSLGGDRGLQIFASGYPRSQLMLCGAGLSDDIEETFTTGANSLRYDPAANQYIYTWATDKTWAGTCRQLQLLLTDGQLFTATFTLRK